MSKLVVSCILIAGMGVGAIAQTNPASISNRRTNEATASTAPTRHQDAAPRLLTVHKRPSCRCCTAWISHMKSAGFRAEVTNEEELDPIKRALGVPERLSSCHTARIDRYFIEGHVPAEDVKRLLAERPDALGLAVPSMPIGSPGMEQGNRREPYDVLLVYRSSKTSVFAHHGR